MSLKSFKYVANDPNNLQIVGTYKAQNRDQVADYLRSRQLFIVSINQDFSLSMENLNNIQFGGVSLKEKMLLIKQLSTMLKAGLPILQTIEILSKQMDNKKIREQLELVKSDIEGGTSLSAAFQKSSDLFNDIQINLLAAGEKSGNLVEVVTQIAIDLEKSNELRSRVRSAMIYPTLIFIAIFIVMIVLIVFMIPTVKNLYQDFNALDKIPDITKFLIGVSDLFSNPVGLGIIILIGIITFMTYKSFSSTPNGKMTLARMQLKLPVFGKLIQKMQLAQFGRLLSMLLKSGVSILDALKIVSSALSSPIYSKAILDTIPEVSKGVPLAVPLASTGVFPLIYIRMISTGEQTGNLDQVLADMGKYYEEEVNDITNNLTKLMEPLILLIVGGMVGFLAVAVYLPIYNIGNVIT